MYRAPQEDSDSDDGQDSATRPSSTDHNVGPNPHASFRELVLNKQTPYLLKLATPSSTSSSGSSSTTSIIFDENLTRAGTPLTPPIPKTPDSRNASKTRLASRDKLPATSFMERLVGTNNSSSVTHTPTTTSAAKTSSRVSSALNLLVEGMGKLSIQEDEGGPGPDKSPTLRISNRMKRDRQAVQGGGDCLQFSTKNGESDHNTKTRGTFRTNKSTYQIGDGAASVAPSAETKLQRNLNLGRDTPRSSERKTPETPALVIQSDIEDGEIAEDISGVVAQNPPLPGQYRGSKSTLSAPRASHQRSKSTSGLHNTNNPITPDGSIPQTSPRNPSSSQPNKTHMSLLNPTAATELESKQRARSAPTRRTYRRHSTGSLESGQTVVPPIECPSSHESGRTRGAFPSGSVGPSESNSQSLPRESPKKTPDLGPDKTRKYPKLEHKHTIQKSENDLKNAILGVIQRRTAKPATKSNLNLGYIYIFKSDRYPGHVKIGSTLREPDDRVKEWGTACKFEAIHVSDENDKAFRFCRIVEFIVHAELHNQRRKFYCDRCKSGHILAMVKRGQKTGQKKLELQPTEHGEWFEISETEAKKVVNKWRDWMIHQKPYKKDATLKACWIWKHDMGMKLMKGTEKEWEVWRQFSWLDILRYGLYVFNQWLGEVSPPLQNLLNSSGSAVVLAAGIYFWTFGTNLASYLTFVTAFLLYRFICFQYC